MVSQKTNFKRLTFILSLLFLTSCLFKSEEKGGTTSVQKRSGVDQSEQCQAISEYAEDDDIAPASGRINEQAFDELLAEYQDEVEEGLIICQMDSDEDECDSSHDNELDLTGEDKIICYSDEEDAVVDDKDVEYITFYVIDEDSSSDNKDDGNKDDGNKDDGNKDDGNKDDGNKDDGKTNPDDNGDGNQTPPSGNPPRPTPTSNPVTTVDPEDECATLKGSTRTLTSVFVPGIRSGSQDVLVDHDGDGKLDVVNVPDGEIVWVSSTSKGTKTRPGMFQISLMDGDEAAKPVKLSGTSSTNFFYIGGNPSIKENTDLKYVVSWCHNTTEFKIEKGEKNLIGPNTGRGGVLVFERGTTCDEETGQVTAEGKGKEIGFRIHRSNLMGPVIHTGCLERGTPPEPTPTPTP